MDPKIYAQGMAMLSAVFPAADLKPDLYYALLEDIREDAFIGGVEKVCRETTELFPNTNLVAVIREKCQEFWLNKNKKRVEVEEKNRLGYEEPSYEEIEKNKKDWNDLRDRLAREKNIGNETKKRDEKL